MAEEGVTQTASLPYLVTCIVFLVVGVAFIVTFSVLMAKKYPCGA